MGGRSFGIARRLVRVIGARVVTLSAPVLPADGRGVTNCPWYPPNNGDDFALRGFYTLGYPGTSLKQVVIPLSFPAPGAYTLSLTASSGTFDGTILGTATAAVTATSTDYQSITFNFGTVPVTQGTAIAFKGAVVTQPSGSAKLLMQIVTDPLSRLTE